METLSEEAIDQRFTFCSNQGGTAPSVSIIDKIQSSVELTAFIFGSLEIMRLLNLDLEKMEFDILWW